MRNGELKDLLVTPRGVPGEHGKTIGRVGFTRVQAYERVSPPTALRDASEQFSMIFVGTVKGIAQLLGDPIKHYGSAVGIIGMERAASALQELGWGPYFGLAASISIALGIFNLLPFPALDGGRAYFIVIELLRGRPLNPEREAFVHVAGFAVLAALMLFIAYRDIVNVISGKGVF
jgi:regulator of sigma E protease